MTELPLEDPGLKLTDAARLRIKESLSQSKQGQAIGIRLGVRKAGCSGYEYQLEYAYPGTKTSQDYEFNFEDIQILVDQEIYLKFLKGGTLLDYGQEGLNEGFKFNNPNVANECGCGESFTLKQS